MTLRINYEDLSVHKYMLGDQVRGEAFRNALREVITPTTVVLDVGAGTGLLSVLAAQAGAKMVYAVEPTSIADVARHVVADNGLQRRIQVIQSDITEAQLPGEVDVIVSEFLGGCGIDENLLPAVVFARDHWLKPGGIVVPSQVSSWVALAFDDMLEADVTFWRSRPLNVELSAIATATTSQIQACRYHVLREHLLSTPTELWDIDVGSISYEAASSAFERTLELRAEVDGVCNALATWFEAKLSTNVVLSNNPSWPATHWGCWVLPIGTTVELSQGDTVQIWLQIEPQEIGRAQTNWKVTIGDYTFASSDMTALAAV